MTKPVNIIGKYRIVATLGRGGMADVYLAVMQGHAGVNKLMVVKELRQDLAQEREFLTMFLDEARLAVRLSHPNVVQTLDFGEDEGRCFIAMEFLDGQPLSRVPARFKKRGVELPRNAQLAMLSDLLEGLHYAHELTDYDGTPLNVVHRDVTPHNVFMTYDGQVKLVDFGIAKALGSNIETRTGVLKGKAPYMSPEQATGDELDRRADIYSVGVMLWEAVTGHRLWDGMSDVAIIARLIKGDIPRANSVDPFLPEELSRICDKALAANAADRYATAEEMRLDIDALLRRGGERPNLRDVGRLIGEVFSDDRQRIREVIDSQIREIRSTSSAPDLSPNVAPATSYLTLSGLPDLSVVTPTNRPSSVHTEATAAYTPRSKAEEAPSVVRHQDAGRTAGLVGVGVTVLGALVGGGWLITLAPNAQPSTSASVSASVRASTPPPTVAGDCQSANKPLIELQSDIEEDFVLKCDKDYLIKFNPRVKSGTTLTIEKGTTLLGDPDTKGTLLVERGARINAVGTPDEPIVFTSARPEGERKAGDWGGLVILGNAPVNLRDEAGKFKRGMVEGIERSAYFGGDDPRDDSGKLEYVRIEYSGVAIAPGNEVNGLTLAGVGSKTKIEHVQVRHTADDCFEFFGGTVNAKYLICHYGGDDGFDWDLGYNGKLQFLVLQQDPKRGKDAHGFEGDNDPMGTPNEPVSHPIIYNATLCGKNVNLPRHQFGMLLRRGTRAEIHNTVVTGFEAGVEVRDSNTDVTIGNSIFFGNLLHNVAFPLGEGEDRESAQDMGSRLMSPQYANSEIDPGIAGCFNPQAPSFGPVRALTQNAVAPPDDGFFDPTAKYVGAVRDSNDAWPQAPWTVWSRR